jgi:hypothetical protein
LHKNCFLILVIKVKIEGTGRRGRGHAQLLDDLEETRRCWKLKEEASVENSPWKKLWTDYTLRDDVED